MIKILETVDSLDILNNRHLLAIPVLSDPSDHYVNNRISFIYFFDISSFDEFIVSVNHNDIKNLQISFLSDVVAKVKYCYHKKYLSCLNQNLDGLKHIVEAETLYWFKTNQRFDQSDDMTIHIFHQWYRNVKNVNDIIPIMRWLEYCRYIKDQFIVQLHKVTDSDIEPLMKYNAISDNFAQIELNGLYTNKNVYEYSEYHPFTLTGRPSNNFNDVNYAALNKTDGTRQRFVSRFNTDGFLLEIDLSGFHMYLLYMMCGLQFPENVYENLAKFYPPDVNPKEYTFRQIYGGIDKSLIDIEPFASIHDLSKQIQKMYHDNELKTFLFDRPFSNFDGEEISAIKIFNYMLQNVETEFNSLIISDLLVQLKSMQSKLILYTYDSFLFDVTKSELKQFMNIVKSVFDKIPNRIKVGHNYENIKEIKISK